MPTYEERFAVAHQMTVDDGVRRGRLAALREALAIAESFEKQHALIEYDTYHEGCRDMADVIATHINALIKREEER